MIRVSGYNPQRVNNTQLKKSNQASFGNGAKTAQAASEVVCPLLKCPTAKQILIKAPELVPNKTDIPAYMGGVPKGVLNPECYLTGPFYLD